jgi:LacI family transcriptional regulator
LLKQGIKIPEEVGIVGFSNEPFSALVNPAITTIDQANESLAEAVVACVLERINAEGKIEPKNIVVPPTLVVRASSLKK